MFFFFQAEDGIRDVAVTGVQTCALPIAGRGGGSDRARALGGGLARGPCQCVGAWDPGGADHALYAAGAAEGEGCGHGAAGLRARTAYAARPTAPLAHLRPGPRDVRAPSLHGADEDSGLLRTSALPLGAGNQ